MIYSLNLKDLSKNHKNYDTLCKFFYLLNINLFFYNYILLVNISYYLYRYKILQDNQRGINLKIKIKENYRRYTRWVDHSRKLRIEQSMDHIFGLNYFQTSLYCKSKCICMKRPGNTQNHKTSIHLSYNRYNFLNIARMSLFSDLCNTPENRSIRTRHSGKINHSYMLNSPEKNRLRR